MGKFKLFEKVWLKYDGIKGIIDATPGNREYRVVTNDGYKWVFDFELEKYEGQENKKIHKVEKKIKWHNIEY